MILTHALILVYLFAGILAIPTPSDATQSTSSSTSLVHKALDMNQQLCNTINLIPELLQTDTRDLRETDRQVLSHLLHGYHRELVRLNTSYTAHILSKSNPHEMQLYTLDSVTERIHAVLMDIPAYAHLIQFMFTSSTGIRINDDGSGLVQFDHDVVPVNEHPNYSWKSFKLSHPLFPSSKSEGVSEDEYKDVALHAYLDLVQVGQECQHWQDHVYHLIQ